MATIKLLYLSPDTDLRGNVRWYVRPPGRRKVRIYELPGTEAFTDAYWAARGGDVPAAAPRIARAHPLLRTGERDDDQDEI